MPNQSAFTLATSYTNVIPSQPLANSSSSGSNSTNSNQQPATASTTNGTSMPQNSSTNPAGTSASSTVGLTDSVQINYSSPFTASSTAGAAGACDVFFRDSQTIANSSSSAVTVTYNLSALPRPGGSAQTVAMARVRKLLVQNGSISTTATDSSTGFPGAVLTVAPSSTGSRGWTNGLGSGGAVPVVPGGVMVMVQPDTPGVVVVSGSNDSFVVSVPGMTVASWQVVVEGCSA